MRPDKAKVVDEIWDEARIAEFLAKPPLGDEPRDFSALLYAYRSMRPDDFERFVELFLSAGRDVNERGTDGRTVLGVIEEHRKAAAFRDILERHGGCR